MPKDNYDAMPLLNKIVNYTMLGRTQSEAIEELLKMGFTVDDLIIRHNFQPDDVNAVWSNLIWEPAEVSVEVFVMQRYTSGLLNAMFASNCISFTNTVPASDYMLTGSFQFVADNLYSVKKQLEDKGVKLAPADVVEIIGSDFDGVYYCHTVKDTFAPTTAMLNKLSKETNMSLAKRE